MTGPKFPIFIELTKVIPTFKKKFEIVERKGNNLANNRIRGGKTCWHVT
jgi:hypothetical protein